MGCGDRFPPMTFSCKHTVLCAIYWVLVLGMKLQEANAQSIASLSREGEVSAFFPIEEEAQFLHDMQDLVWQAVAEGHVFSSLDTLEVRADTLFVNLYLGTRYRWDKVYIEGNSKPIRKGDLRYLLNEYTGAGYPFASFCLDSVFLDGKKASANISIQTGPEITFDTLSISGDAKVSQRYLHTVLNFPPGSAYSEKKYEAIGQRIKNAKQVTLVGKPDVSFTADKAKVYLNLKDEKNDSFEGILGLLPEQGRSSTVTGYMSLDLNNLFRSGKEFHFDWNRFSRSSQKLDLSYIHPYLLDSDLLLRTDFSILRQDSAFVKRNFGLRIDLALGAKLFVGFGVRAEASDLLGTNPDPLQGLDFRLTEYQPAIRIGSQGTLQRFENDQGATFSVGFGDKRIRRNVLFDAAFFDTLALRSTNYKIDFSWQGQRTFGKQQAVYSRMEGGILRGQQLVRNEFYRLGGLKSLRGFNENEFFVSQFLKAQLEYRFFFDSKSYFVVLGDFALLGTDAEEQNFDTFSRSFGGGFSLDTSSGNFQFIFALGVTEEIPFNIQNTKVHFGYAITF